MLTNFGYASESMFLPANGVTIDMYAGNAKSMFDCPDQLVVEPTQGLVNGGFGGLSRLAASGTDEVKRSQKVGRFAIRYFAVECLGAGIRTPTPTGFSLC